MKQFFLKTFTLMALISITAVSNAQLHYGLRAGLNYSAISEPFDLNNGNHFKPGTSVGLTVGYNLNETFAISTEALYQTKGAKVLNLYSNTILDVEYDLNYLTIPLLLEAQFGEKYGMPESWRLNAYAGPYFGRLIDASNNYEDDETITDLNEIVNDNDAGFVLGIGVAKNVGAIDIYSDIRYEAGFTNILEENDDLRNRTFSINVGVLF